MLRAAGGRRAGPDAGLSFDRRPTRLSLYNRRSTGHKRPGRPRPPPRSEPDAKPRQHPARAAGRGGGDCWWTGRALAKRGGGVLDRSHHVPVKTTDRRPHDNRPHRRRRALTRAGSDRRRRPRPPASPGRPRPIHDRAGGSPRRRGRQRRDRRRRAPQRDRRRRTRRRAARPPRTRRRRATAGNAAPPNESATPTPSTSRPSPAPAGSDSHTARSPPPPRSRTAPSARSSPAPPRPQHNGARSRAAIAGQRGGRARRIAADRQRPAAGTPARGRAPGAPSARRSSCAPRLVALRQPLGQVIAIRPAPGEIDDAAAHARRLEVGRDPRGRLPPGAVTVQHHRHVTTSEQPRPLRAPRRHRPAPRSRAARASGR